MKVSTALQIFGTIMTSGGDNWQPGMPQTAIDITPRTDLDLCACLDVELADDLSQELYGDAVPQEATWEENVIDLTSSGEIASAGEVDFQEISSRETVMSDPNTYSTSSLSAEAMNYANMFGLGVTDNANLLPSENFQAGELNSTEFLTSTYSNPFRRLMTSAATTTTVDLSALESLSFNTDSSLQYVDDSTSSSYTSSVPSSLWNVDFVTACNPSGSHAPDSLLSGFPAEVDPVKETLKSRLQTRGMTSSAVQDGDSFCSSRLSQSSSTSSCTQSMDEDDTDDPLKGLDRREKNRLAAQKCRNKKRNRTEALEKDISRLEDKQERLRQEVRNLEDERETLEEMIHIHGSVCSKMRKTSNT